MRDLGHDLQLGPAGEQVVDDLAHQAAGRRDDHAGAGQRGVRHRVAVREVAAGPADQDERLLLQRQHVDARRGDRSGRADQAELAHALADLVDDLIRGERGRGDRR